jgi:hypothetical protein
MYRYIYTGRGAEYCYSVGFTSSSGLWTHESYHETADEAARRVHYLNGGNGHPYDWPKIVPKARELNAEEQDEIF